MSGTFLNFFECKLSNNIVEVYTTDYKDKETFEELRKNILIYIFIGLREIKYTIGKNIKIALFLQILEEFVYIYHWMIIHKYLE